MGNGLSELQKGLLLMALANTGRRIGERERGFIKRLQIKDTRELPHLTTPEALQGRNHASARASISQAFSRIEKRGLVRKDYQYKVGGPLLWSGIDNPLSLTYWMNYFLNFFLNSTKSKPPIQSKAVQAKFEGILHEKPLSWR